jgi:hypothetical protein
MRRYLALAGLLLAAPAAAQDRPQLTPTRDVAVTYRQTGASAPQGMPPIVIAWNAASGLMRSEMAGIGWSVVDMRAGRGFLVMEQMRTIMDMPAGQLAVLPGQSPKASFRREGTATVAGLPCTIWFVQDGSSQGRAWLEATQVRFAPQDPARFQRPQGYQAMQGMPGMPPAARQPGR